MYQQKVALAGATRPELVSGVVQPRPEDAMFDAMLRGRRAQQKSRGLKDETIDPGERLVRRFLDFANDYPWQWTPAHMDEWSASLTGEKHLAPSTIRSYQGDIRLFTEFLIDGRPPAPRRTAHRPGKWITETVQTRTDLAERRILHGYPVWHHMRRLRRRLGEDHTTRLQDLNVRCHVTAADSFLTRLNREGLTLGTCTRPDLERWMGDATVSYRDETGHFVRWPVQHRHARGLTFTAPSAGPAPRAPSTARNGGPTPGASSTTTRCRPRTASPAFC
ncbi:hypothetical protein [Streptomyces qinglanensis]|uniref:hypothetical protein n=1 Tax=Streptomyces qinglanensis TaxID=943816 RepID=UPI003D706B70